jgi:hypothetical protein
MDAPADDDAVFRVDLNASSLAGTLVFGQEDLRPRFFAKHPGKSNGYVLIHKSPNAFELDLDKATVKGVARFPSIRADVYSYDVAIEDTGKMLICQGESFLEVDTATMGLLATHWLPPATSLWDFVLSSDRKRIYAVTNSGSDASQNLFLAINRADYTVQARPKLARSLHSSIRAAIQPKGI